MRFFEAVRKQNNDAQKMKYSAHVRDGSEHKLVPGYWYVEVYAHLQKKHILPSALDVFSIDAPNVDIIAQSNLWQAVA